MSIPPNQITPTNPLTGGPWPEIDRLTPDAAVVLDLSPTWYSAGKVVLDVLVTAVLLPFALALIGLACVAVKLTSTGPALYTQTRAGLNGRRYRIIKIRTMYHDCEVKSGIRWSTKNDDRVTPVGRFLRMTHIDELPQLFNVMLGQMSLVGPRPERPEVIQARGLDHLVPGYKHRLRLKPGVTGLAQVQLPADSNVDSVRYKVVYDLYYAQHQSLFLDIRLLLATLLKAAGASPRTIQRVFFLPGRKTVAAVFRANIATGTNPVTQLQPA